MYNLGGAPQTPCGGWILNSGAHVFAQDIGNWVTSNVTNMESMFDGADNFNKNITKWTVINGTILSQMFKNSGMIGYSYGLSTPTPLYTEFIYILLEF